MKNALALVSLVFIVLIATVCTSGTSQTTTVAARVFAVESVSKRVDTKAVDFTWKEGGKTISFSEFTKGKVVLLNIWACTR